MTTFRYTATDEEGNSNDGELDAHSMQAAREALIAMGLEPVEIVETPRSGEKDDAPMPDPLPIESSPPPLDIQAPENPPPTITEEAPKREVPADTEHVYFPLLETLRLYAGWLLAWYCLVYAIGSYQFMKELPFRLPYAESLFLSPLVLSFTFAAYLFLLLSGVYRNTGKKRIIAFFLFLIGIAVFVLYRMNVQ